MCGQESGDVKKKSEGAWNVRKRLLDCGTWPVGIICF